MPQTATTKTPPATAKLRLTLDVDYVLNGESIDALGDRLKRMVQYAFSDGLMTGRSLAEVADFSMEVKETPPLLDEDTLAAYMLQRIESGDLDLADIPVRLARFGLMDPAVFSAEMAERMEMAKEEALG